MQVKRHLEFGREYREVNRGPAAGQDLERRFGSLGGARHLEHIVEAQSVGDFHGAGDRVLVKGIDRVLRAHGERQLAFFGYRIDDCDASRTREQDLVEHD